MGRHQAVDPSFAGKQQLPRQGYGMGGWVGCGMALIHPQLLTKWSFCLRAQLPSQQLFTPAPPAHSLTHPHPALGAAPQLLRAALGAPVHHNHHDSVGDVPGQEKSNKFVHV